MMKVKRLNCLSTFLYAFKKEFYDGNMTLEKKLPVKETKILYPNLRLPNPEESQCIDSWIFLLLNEAKKMFYLSSRKFENETTKKVTRMFALQEKN